MGGMTRRVLLRRASVALGVAAATTVVDRGVETAVADVEARGPLPIYGSAASAIRPDQSRPSCGQLTVTWSGARAGARAGAPTASSAPGRIALTFDDGPHPRWTPQVLEALARHRAVATFFVRGDNLERYPHLHRTSRESGHEIANHSWDHPDLARLTLAEATGQLTRTTSAITALTGAAPTLFRPPYGHLAGTTLLAAAQAGLHPVLWSAQVHEDQFATRPDELAPDLAARLVPGDIVLAHDSGSSDRALTVDHLDRILDALESRGYELVTVSELLAPVPAA